MSKDKPETLSDTDLDQAVGGGNTSSIDVETMRLKRGLDAGDGVQNTPEGRLPDGRWIADGGDTKI